MTDLLDAARGVLLRHGQGGRARPWAGAPGGVQQALHDRGGRPVGALRIWADGDRVGLRWTRPAWGFWFERAVPLAGVAGAARALAWAADGTVPLRALLRLDRRVKKGARDRASEAE
jgi:hypothetical protein